MNKTSSLSAIAFGALILSSYAQADVLCLKSGKAYVRASCKAREQTVQIPGPQGPQGVPGIGLPGPQGPQGPAGPSGVNTSPCTIDSIAGTYSFQSIGNNPFFLEGCTFVIQPDGAFGNPSNCSGARVSGAFGPIPISGKVNLVFGPSCNYRFEYTYSNGENWMYNVQLNSTRSNILGNTISNSGLAGTVVGTRWYPTGTASTSGTKEINNLSSSNSVDIDALASHQQKWLSEVLSSMNKPE